MKASIQTGLHLLFWLAVATSIETAQAQLG
jgi:hypothetical protein